MRRWKEYHMPASVEEALTLLGRWDDARLIAGGTDLILDMESGHTDPAGVLIDVTRIQGIDRIRRQQEEGHDWIVIGAGVTHRQIEASPLLQRGATCLSESCGVVGGPQVRTVATIGGNVAHALPAADGTIGLLALDAQVGICSLVAGRLERTWQPLLSIFAGPGRNTLGRHQMIEAFRFRATGEQEASAFDRIMRPQGIALPILGVAVRVRLAADGKGLDDVRLAIGPAGPIPFRATQAEALLRSATRLDPSVLDAAVTAAQAQAHLRTSKHRASQAYRFEMVGVLLRRVLPRAMARARGVQEEAEA